MRIKKAIIGSAKRRVVDSQVASLGVAASPCSKLLSEEPGS